MGTGMNHRRTRQSKRKTILGLIIAVVAVIIFGAVMYAVDVHSRQSEGKGDSGKWTAGLSDGTTLTLDETWIATAAEDALAFEFTLEDAEDGWAFHDEVTGGYLYAASSNSNWLRTEAELDANGIFIIAYEGDDGATVPVAQGENTRGYMHYNGKSDIFSCYADTSSITGAVYLYKLVEDEPETLENGFYLIGPDWTINDIDAANKFGESRSSRSRTTRSPRGIRTVSTISIRSTRRTRATLRSISARPIQAIGQSSAATSTSQRITRSPASPANTG